jgi:plastocyanin
VGRLSRLALVGILAASVFVVGTTPVGAARKVIKTKGSPGNFFYEPSVRRIHKGDKIVWKNPSNATHTVTAYSSNWGKDKTLAPGTKTRKVFRKRGAFKFRCMTPGHSSLNEGKCSGMCGKIRVRRRAG